MPHPRSRAASKDATAESNDSSSTILHHRQYNDGKAKSPKQGSRGLKQTCLRFGVDVTVARHSPASPVARHDNLTVVTQPVPPTPSATADIASGSMNMGASTGETVAFSHARRHCYTLRHRIHRSRRHGHEPALQVSQLLFLRVPVTDMKLVATSSTIIYISQALLDLHQRSLYQKISVNKAYTL